MTQKNRLASVPDTEILPLYSALITFLGREAQQRGWQEVANRLLAVEAALDGKDPTSPT